MAALASNVSTVVRQVAENYRKAKSYYDRKEDAACEEVLDEIKKYLIIFPTFLNPSAKSATRAEELTLAREVLELGALLSARQKDLDSFGIYFSQLNIYYSDFSSDELPASASYLMILGLNLVCLLVTSRIAQFHSELEKIPHEVRADNSFIRFAVLLERCLMEGSYNKLLNSRGKAPSNEYIPVVELLESTVRNEVAKCIPHAYNELSIQSAQKILMIETPQKAKEIGLSHGWKMNPSETHFLFVREEDISKKEIPFREMLKNHIQFASDMQRIV